MPLTGTTYVSPLWRNGQAPAIDAAELQAITDTLAAAQAKNLSQDSLIAALQTAVSALQSGGAKIELGSYVGTGTFGTKNPNSITFSFAPKVVWIYGFTLDTSPYSDVISFAGHASGSTVPMDALTTSYVNKRPPYSSYSEAVTGAYSKKSSDGRELTWYNSNMYNQLNSSGNTFFWVAFG